MTTKIIIVGISVGLLVVGLLGGYAIAEQMFNPKNMMNDPKLHQQMMNQMMNNPKMQDMMGMSGDDNSKMIHMGMNSFMPNELSVEPNTTVTWQTHDIETHNVVGIFKTDSGNEIPILSGDIEHMESWNYTFEESGVFEYVCGYHESEEMKGRLVVT